MEIKGTNVNLNQKIKEDSQAGKKLAKEMMLFADDNSAAVSKKEFQEKLNKLQTLSTEDLIKFIRSFDKDESIIELICDEIGDDKKVRKEACKKVLNALVNKAKELGIETSDFEKQFAEELGSQFGFLGKYINTDKLDSIINALTQSIENRQNLTAEDVQTVQNTPAAEGQEQANGVIENRLEKAYAAFGERVGEDGEMTDVEKVLINKTTGEKTEVKYKDGQMQRDGIAADIADGVSRIWGSKNTADKIREDLKATNAQLQQLKEAKSQGEEAYKAKFKGIFGVEYDYANMVAYQKAEATYINASSNHEFEMMFNRTLKTLLSPAPLREEFDYIDGGDGKVIATKTATKEQVFEREFNSLAEFLTQKDSNGNEIKGTEILNAAFEEKGVANGTIEEKFEVLKQIAKTLSKELHSATLEAGGGKEFSEVQAMYDNSYKAAYGVENDIMKRVTDYNVSQEIGAGVVKAGVTIAASLAAAFSGIGLVGVAAITAGTTVGAEVIDRGTSGNALNALREDGVGAYIKTANNDINWEATLKQAAMSGGAVLIGSGVAQGVTAIMKGSSTVAQFAAMLGADVVTDATMEFLTTKQITWEGMVFTVLISTITNAAQLNQMNKTAKLGMKMMEEDGIQILYNQEAGYIETINDKGLRADIPQKNLSEFSDEVARTYYNYKQSGLDIETFMKQNPDASDHLPYLVSDTRREAHELTHRALWLKDAKAQISDNMQKIPSDVRQELSREKIYHLTNEDYVVPAYSIEDKLKITNMYIENPHAALKMLSSDFVPTSTLEDYLDDVKRLAYSADGPNAKLIKQYASEVEDMTRQVIALRAEGIAPRAEENRTFANKIAQQAIEKAKNASRLASENPYMITNIATAEEVGNIAEQVLKGKKYRIAIAGYSAPPAGYEEATKFFLKALDDKLGSAGYITSPTANAGSIDAITTEIAGFKEGRIFYTTAQDYVDYINPANFPKDINTTAYLDAPKYVLPDGASYSQATAAASNTLIAIGGRAATVSDFCNAIKKGNLAVIFDNTALNAPAWGTRPGKTNPEVLNASRYLKEQTDAFLAGKPLPYPETGNFTIEFMNIHKNDLTNLVKFVTTDGSSNLFTNIAASNTAKYIQAPRDYDDFIDQLKQTVNRHYNESEIDIINSRINKYDKVIERLYYEKTPDGTKKYSIDDIFKMLRDNNVDGSDLSTGVAASSAAKYIQAPKNYDDFTAQLRRIVYDHCNELEIDIINSRINKYDKVIERLYYEKTPDGIKKYSIDDIFKMLRGCEVEVMYNLNL